jgi:hypothetical protein
MLAALGAGLVLTAVAAGAGGYAGAALVGCGIAALAQGVLALRAGRLVAPASTLGGCLGVLAGSAAVVVTGSAGALDIAIMPLLAADLFVLVVAFGAAADLRKRRGAAAADVTVARTRREAREPQRRLPIMGMLAGAALTAALATPALAATEAGGQAVPHGQLHGDLDTHSDH